MHKFLSYTTLIFCILIYILSSDQTYTNELNLYKANSTSIIRTDKFKHGDLYGLSYLSNFNTASQKGTIKYSDCNYSKKIDLYAIGDSYLWAFMDSAKYFCGVDKYLYAKTNARENIKVNVNSTKINVLLLEFTERNVLKILRDSSYISNVILPSKNKSQVDIYQENGVAANVPNPKPESKIASGSVFTKSSLITLIKNIKKATFDFLFNKEINTNLESNIWDIAFFTPIKEFKVSLNYKLFHTLNKDVRLSKDGRQLFYNLTIDTSKITSSFKYISNTEIDTLVNRLNRIYDNARKMGFHKIYFSIIPNPVSILEPDFDGLIYNRLVERIQASPKLYVSCINVIPDFQKSKNTIFFPSDTHWNYNGASMWLSKFNNELEKIVTENALPAKDNSTN